jgi:hypothetical protein
MRGNTEQEARGLLKVVLGIMIISAVLACGGICKKLKASCPLFIVPLSPVARTGASVVSRRRVPSPILSIPVSISTSTARSVPPT